MSGSAKDTDVALITTQQRRKVGFGTEALRSKSGRFRTMPRGKASFRMKSRQ